MQQPTLKHAAWIAPALLAFLTQPLHGGQDDGHQAAQAMQDHVGAVIELATAGETTARLGPDERARLERDLLLAEESIAADDWLGSLRPYARVTESLAQATVVFETGPITDLEGLARERKALDSQLERVGSPLEMRAQRPAALQALLERAHSTARAYLASAAEQARETNLRAGIYYLRVARERTELAQLLTRLVCPAPERPLAELRGLEQYFKKLELELLELYEPPLSQERHATFIRLSASLKFAREMNGLGHRHGALESALDVARGLAAFSSGDPAAEFDGAMLREELDHWQAVVAKEGSDVSLPELWLARARQDLEGEQTDLAEVDILVGRVLPDYFSCLRADPTQALVETPTVQVTLVRWPFT